MELDGDHLKVTRRGQVAAMPLQALTKAPALRKGMLGTALTINSQEYGDVTVKAAGHFAAMGFAEDVKEAWTRFNLSALKKEEARLDRILAEVLSLAAPSRYPAQHRRSVSVSEPDLRDPAAGGGCGGMAGTLGQPVSADFARQPRSAADRPGISKL